MNLPEQEAINSPYRRLEREFLRCAGLWLTARWRGEIEDFVPLPYAVGAAMGELDATIEMRAIVKETKDVRNKNLVVRETCKH